MSRYRFKLGLVSRVEGLAMIPGFFNGRNDPEVASRISHHPLLRRPMYKQPYQSFCYCIHILLSSIDQLSRQNPNVRLDVFSAGWMIVNYNPCVYWTLVQYYCY